MVLCVFVVALLCVCVCCCRCDSYAMRCSLVACALVVMAAFGAPAAAMPQGTLAPMAKLQAQIGDAAESAALVETAPANPKELIPGTKEWENSAQCFVGDVNVCTRESKAWGPRSQMANLGDLNTKIPNFQNILDTGKNTPKPTGFALIEGEAEADAEAEADEEADVETEAEAEADAEEDESSALLESDASRGKCSGRCQAINLPCSTSYVGGLCTGKAKCCVAARRSTRKTNTTPKKSKKPKTSVKQPKTTKTPKKTIKPKKTSTTKAPTTKSATTKKTKKTKTQQSNAPEPVGPLTLTGVADRIKDPRTQLLRKGHRMNWADFTTVQQTNARLLVRAVRAELPTASVNMIAYVLGTANWECLLHPISEWGGRNTRYAPYYGRGFVQLTWEKNYKKMTDLLLSERGITANLVEHPNLALDPTNAAFVAAYGTQRQTCACTD